MRWKLPVALMVAGALCGVPLVVHAITSVGASITAPSHRTPFAVTKDLDEGTYVVYERTGTNAQVGPLSAGVNDAPTISPQVVSVVAPDGEPLPTEYLTHGETITQGNAVYTGVVEFHVSAAGPHRIAVGGEGRQVLVTRSLGSVFGDLLGSLGLAAVGGLLFLVGGALLVLGLVRRPSGRPPAAAAGPPAAGWYPDPKGEARIRYWDGSAWTEHVAA